VSRRGHRIDLLDQDGRKEGIALATGDGQAHVHPRRHGQQRHPAQRRQRDDRGQERRHVDAGSSSLKLTGGDVSITATTGLTLDGSGPRSR
jgi:hypothetical protein